MLGELKKGGECPVEELFSFVFELKETHLFSIPFILYSHFQNLL